MKTKIPNKGVPMMNNTETTETKLTYAAFIKQLASLTNEDEDCVKKIFDAGVDLIGKQAYAGKVVEIRNFGSFRTKKTQGRKVALKNVSEFSAYTKFQFKPSNHFTKMNRIRIGEINKER